MKKLKGGIAEKKGVTPQDVNKKQLQMGVKVEKEHTNDPSIAKEIATDHLAEVRDYYTRLKKMEKTAAHLKHPQVKSK